MKRPVVRPMIQPTCTAKVSGPSLQEFPDTDSSSECTSQHKKCILNFSLSITRNIINQS